MARLQQIKMNRLQRRNRRRRQIRGSAERPRLSVHFSAKHIRLQVIDDDKGQTLVATSTVGKDHKTPLSQQAGLMGEEIALLCQKAKVKKVVLDSGQRAYKKRLNALATQAREKGLEF